MLRRSSGLSPEYSGLPYQSRKRSSDAITQPMPTEQLFRTVKKPRPASEPIRENEKVVPGPPLAVTEMKDVTPLSNDEILAILSREMPLEKASIIQTFMSRSNIINQEVPSIYSSYFFRKDIIKEFQRNVINKLPSDKLAKFPLSTYNLYNKDDVLNNTTYRPDILGSRIAEKSSKYSTESNENMQKFLKILGSKICSKIGGTYAKSAVEKAIDLTKNEEKFDILIASTRVMEDVTLTMEQRLQGVVAFIIVELGECHKYPSAYSINLICANDAAITGTGSVLMAAFLYTILSHPDNTKPTGKIRFPKGDSFLKVTSKTLSNGSKIEKCTFGSVEPLVPVQQIAVLELASAYNNAGGLCMYEKFGFTYDQTMFSDVAKGIECFNDRDNLPMLIDFYTKPGYAQLDKNGQKQKIVDILIGSDKGYPKSKICGVRGDYQRLLGMIKSIKLYIDNEPGSSLADFVGTESLILHKIR
jgi:hypothetical protein